MEMNESSIIGGTKYWYDTKHHTSSWKAPSKKDIDNHIQQFQQQEEQEHKSDGKYLSEGAAREWSTVVDISIPPPSFKPVSLSLSRISSILKHPNKSFLTQ